MYIMKSNQYENFIIASCQLKLFRKLSMKHKTLYDDTLEHIHHYLFMLYHKEMMKNFRLKELIRKDIFNNNKCINCLKKKCFENRLCGNCNKSYNDCYQLFLEDRTSI